ncbi:hypothetical protein [Gymnodinialimonas hymeniacidonis]|uniref:hypothetical protein n=1 Tax=Gymnodinialimonas hymeniacidonis TaxID=3126508 RepID=UPI0034C5D1F4
MCYGHVNVKVLEREVQDRLRAAHTVGNLAPECEPQAMPPELIGGFRGLWARMRAGPLARLGLLVAG